LANLGRRGGLFCHGMHGSSLGFYCGLCELKPSFKQKSTSTPVFENALNWFILNSIECQIHKDDIQV
jgi:hypothetical protein